MNNTFTKIASVVTTVLFTQANPCLANTQSLGAKYIAQGGAYLANGNDLYSVSNNPASILLHSNEDFIEVSINMISQEDSVLQESENTDSFVGIAGARSAFGGAYGVEYKGRSAEVIDANNGQVLLSNHEISRSFLSLALGNVQEEPTGLTYGVGCSFDMFSIDLDKANEIEVRANTYGAKVSYNAQSIFDKHLLSTDLSLAVSHSDEVSFPIGTDMFYIVRPATTQVGASLRLMHLNSTVPWIATFSADVSDSSTDSKYVNSREIIGTSTRVGTELRFIKPFNTGLDLSVRLGQKSYDAIDDSFSSTGIGVNYKNWYIDLSVNEDEFANSDAVYNLSATYSF